MNKVPKNLFKTSGVLWWCLLWQRHGHPTIQGWYLYPTTCNPYESIVEYGGGGSCDSAVFSLFGDMIENCCSRRPALSSRSAISSCLSSMGPTRFRKVSRSPLCLVTSVILWPWSCSCWSCACWVTIRRLFNSTSRRKIPDLVVFLSKLFLFLGMTKSYMLLAAKIAAILERARRKSFWSALAFAFPSLQVKRVKLSKFDELASDSLDANFSTSSTFKWVRDNNRASRSLDSWGRLELSEICLTSRRTRARSDNSFDRAKTTSGACRIDTINWCIVLAAVVVSPMTAMRLAVKDKGSMAGDDWSSSKTSPISMMKSFIEPFRVTGEDAEDAEELEKQVDEVGDGGSE